MTRFKYDTIVPLYTSGGVLQNKSTYTPFTRSIFLQLRDDIDYLGEQLSQTGASWTANNFDWDKGTRYALDADNRLWLSYITDMRTACEDLSTTAGITAPTWTIATVNLIKLDNKGSTATISGTVLTDTSKGTAPFDFSDVTNSTDYCHIKTGTGATRGKYLITAHTTNTLTLSGYSGDSAAGDVTYLVPLSGNRSTHIDPRKVSLIEDVRTAIIDIANANFTYWVNADTGDDAETTPTYAAPLKTYAKACSLCNSVNGNIFLQGASAAYVTSATANEYLGNTSDDIVVQGESLDTVDFTLTDASAARLAWNNQGTIFRDIFFNRNATTITNIGNLVSIVLSADFENCAFVVQKANEAAAPLNVALGATINFNHCSLYGKDGTSDKAISVNIGRNDITINTTDCHFFDIDDIFDLHNSPATGTVINADYCTFENNNTINDDGYGNYTPTNIHVTSTTNVLDITSGHLYDDSDLIDEASDGFDIGCIPDGWYNQIVQASDSITVADTTEMSLEVFADDSIILHDDLESITMNLSVDMLLGGLFESDNAGGVTYQASTDVSAQWIPNFTYNGASIDASWDNVNGDSCELHILASDGVTDYDPAAWWESNALNPAITTTQTNGTRGYGIDLFLETQTGIEWGDAGDFSTVSADGVNDQQWDITLKVRVKNVTTGQWSEVITATKTYNFSDFDETMYYCADNPRLVADEYANHANYLAQPYHTTTAKYTRPDGVDWFNDYRRYAYSPMEKMIVFMPNTAFVTGTPALSNLYNTWQTRKITSTSSPLYLNIPQTELGLYASIGCNYGNYSNSSLFAAPSTTQVYDEGTATFNYPVMGSGTSNIRYLKLRAYEGSDCAIHSSLAGYIVYMPTDEIFVRDDFSGKPAIVSPTTHKYNQEDRQPFDPPCSSRNGYYFHTKQNAGGDMPSGDVQWAFTDQKWWINTSPSGTLDYGDVNPRKTHTWESQTFNDTW